MSLLEKMHRNPQGGWTIKDVETVCAQYGVLCRPPSTHRFHYKVSHPQAVDILIIPCNRPIKSVYIRRLVHYIKAVTARNA